MTVATTDDDRGNTHHRQGSDFCFFFATDLTQRKTPCGHIQKTIAYTDDHQ